MPRTQVDFSIKFHPQTDRQAEHAIETLKDMYRGCVIGVNGSWDGHLPIF